jgi:pyruvate dehydrogenase (quinone)
VAVVAVLDLPLRAYAMLDCDVLLMLGTDFPYRQFYPQGSGVRIPPVNW